MSTEPEKPIAEPGAATRMQILATEHWSLLATRSLTYSESLSRVSMFLSVLSGAVIALALIAQADHFGKTFVLLAILILSVVLFVGIATVVRLDTLNQDDVRWVVGMNRLRQAYHELHPDLERYFVTSRFDDFRGAGLTLGFDSAPSRGLGQIGHGMQTLPGMISVLTAVVAGALGGLIAHAFNAPLAAMVSAAVGASLAAALLFGALGLRSFLRWRASFSPRFPGPKAP